MDPDGKWTSTRAVLLAAPGQNCWPPAGSYMAATGQDPMAADRHDHPRRCQRRRDRPPRPPGRRRPPMKASSAPLGDSVAVTAAGAGIRSWRCRGGAAARPSAKMVCGGPLGVGAARRDTLAVERPASPRPVGGAGVPPTGRVGSRGRHHRSSQASASAPWRAMAASVSAGSLSRVSVTPRVAVSPSPRRRRVNSAPG